MARPPAILFWVQHLLGTGHLSRLLAVANETARLGARVIVASGGPPGHFAIPHGVELVQLPPIWAKDSTLKTLVRAGGEPVDQEYWQARQQRLLDLLQPDVPAAIVIEMFPFGRRKFHNELVGLIQSTKLLNPRACIICSLRDVLVTQRRIVRLTEMVTLARQYFDKILVHSDAEVIPLAHSFAPADEIKDLCAYTGYVVSRSAVALELGRAGVVVSAGGGIVGRRLIDAALRTAPHTRLADSPWTIVTGPRAEEQDVQAWRTAAAGNVTVVRHAPELAKLIAQARLSISQAGYNTVAETLFARTPAVLVPFETATEDEQLIRASAIARRGLAQIVREADLSSSTLAAAIERAIESDPAARPINFDGAHKSANRILGLVAGAS